MPYRVVGHAEGKIEAILLETARRWGTDATARYNRLIMAAMTAVGDSPAMLGSRDVPGLVGVRTLHLRSVRRLVPREYRVGQPRHLVVYRVAPDGVVEILSLVHDRMLLVRATVRARREAGG